MFGKVEVGLLQLRIDVSRGREIATLNIDMEFLEKPVNIFPRHKKLFAPEHLQYFRVYLFTVFLIKLVEEPLDLKIRIP